MRDHKQLPPGFLHDSVAMARLPRFAQQVAVDVNGTFSYVDNALFEEVSRTRLRSVPKWLQPLPLGAPTFGVFAWGAAHCSPPLQ